MNRLLELLLALIKWRWFIPAVVILSVASPVLVAINRASYDDDCAEACKRGRFDAGQAEPFPGDDVLCVCYRNGFHRPTHLLIQERDQ